MYTLPTYWDMMREGCAREGRAGGGVAVEME